MFSRYSWLVITILTFLVSLTSWIAVKNSQLDTGNQGVVQTGYINQLTITKMNQFGTMQYYAEATSASQYSNGDYHFQAININYYPVNNLGQVDNTPWNLMANNASTINNNTEIDLSGQVNLSRVKEGNTPPIKIETPFVSLFPQSNSLYGNQAVTITIPNTQNITTAVGFSGNLSSKVINLLSQVSSIYEPYLSH